jgi:hypothetical protein
LPAHWTLNETAKLIGSMNPQDLPASRLQAAIHNVTKNEKTDSSSVGYDHLEPPWLRVSPPQEADIDPSTDFMIVEHPSPRVKRPRRLHKIIEEDEDTTELEVEEDVRAGMIAAMIVVTAHAMLETRFAM